MSVNSSVNEIVADCVAKKATMIREVFLANKQQQQRYFFFKQTKTQKYSKQVDKILRSKETSDLTKLINLEQLLQKLVNEDIEQQNSCSDADLGNRVMVLK